MSFSDSLNEFGDAVIQWADPTGDFTGYTKVSFIRSGPMLGFDRRFCREAVILTRLVSIATVGMVLD